MLTPDNDEQSSKQGAFLVGGILVVGVLALLVISQLGGSKAVTSTEAEAIIVQSEVASELDNGAADNSNSDSPSSTLATPSTTLTPSTTTASPETEGQSTTAPATSDQSLTVTVNGDWLPPLSSGGLHSTTASDPVVGAVAPEISGMDFDGKPFTIGADGVGKVVVFIAHWCPHCQKEVPQIVQLAEAGLVPEGVQIIAVSTAVDESRGNYPPQAWLEAEQWPFPVIQDNETLELFQAYGGTGFPFAVMLDGEHTVVGRAVGSLDIAQMLEAWELVAK